MLNSNCRPYALVAVLLLSCGESGQGTDTDSIDEDVTSELPWEDAPDAQTDSADDIPLDQRAELDADDLDSSVEDGASLDVSDADDGGVSEDVSNEEAGDDAEADGPDAETDSASNDAAQDATPPRDYAAVKINEVDCHGSEWVELFFDSAEPVDLGGCVLSDGGASPVPYVIPHGVVVPPSGFVSLRRQTESRDGFLFGISCELDTIRLAEPSGASIDVFEVVAVGDLTTACRYPDGAEALADCDPTRDAANQLAVDDSSEFYDPFTILNLDITAPESSIAALYASPYEWVPGNVRISRGTALLAESEMEFRIKGRIGSARTLDQKAALKIRFLSEGEESLVFDLGELTLNNMVQDASNVHEALSYSIFRAMDVAAPRVGYAWVNVNGAVFGLYANIESIELPMLRRFYGGTTHLYEGQYGNDFFPEQVAGMEMDEGDPDDRSDLAAVVAQIWAGDLSQVYDNTQELIDWPRVVSEMLVEQYVGHWDGYAPTRNNFYIHFDENGMLSLIPWGTDQTFGDYRRLSDGQGILLQACFASPACQQLFYARLGTLSDLIEGLQLQQMALDLQTFLAPWVAIDPRREYGLEWFDYGIAGTVDFLNNRIPQMRALAECFAGPDADPDRDGSLCDADCAPDDPTIYPGAVDACGDGIDQDCNGRPDDAPECPDCIGVESGVRRYEVCYRPRSFAVASENCRLRGGALAKIETGSEAVFIASLAAIHGDLWLGLNDLENEGEFEWIDGEEPRFSRWEPGEPNDAGGEDCAGIYGFAGTWNDFVCEWELGSICEMECQEPEDLDGDRSFACVDDCNDADRNINPSAVDVCESELEPDVDSDCNPFSCE